MKKLIKWILARYLGLKLVKMTDYEVFLTTNEATRKYVLPNSMLNLQRLANIMESIDFVNKNKIDGDYVECGVWKGGSVALAAIHLSKSDCNTRNVHLFDAFGDICEPDHKVDGLRAIKEAGGIERAQGRLQESGLYKNLGLEISNVDEVKKIFNLINYERGSVNFHVGWFQDTTPKASKAIKSISVLRLDGDWYESTKVCLENLYKKVSTGGIIIIDDYGAYDGCAKAVDEFLTSNKISPFIKKIDNEAVYWIKDE